VELASSAASNMTSPERAADPPPPAAELDPANDDEPAVGDPNAPPAPDVLARVPVEGLLANR
jgi:hypothetical protein